MTNVEDIMISPNDNEDGKYQNADPFIQGVKKEEEEIDTTKFEIFSFPVDNTLLGYQEQWKRKELFIPDFQREYVWDTKRASRLIESFLLGVPVPPVFLYKPKNESKFWVIDGQQRIKTIVSFMKGYFVYGNPQDEDTQGKKTTFKLRGVRQEWEGKFFEDLKAEEKFQLENTVLRSIIIRQMDDEDEKSIYTIFERLNTGGVNLNPMEIRLCVSYGKFADSLKQLNESDAWRKLLSKPQLDRRYRDVEWILRSIALNDEWEYYDSPMKNFLNNYMGKHDHKHEKKKNFDEWLISKIDLFQGALEKASWLSDKPFHLFGHYINLAAMDSILVAMMSLHDKKIDKEKLKSAYEKLMLEDSDYFQSITIGRGTNDKDKVQFRIELAKSEFEKAIKS